MKSRGGLGKGTWTERQKLQHSMNRAPSRAQCKAQLRRTERPPCKTRATADLAAGCISEQSSAGSRKPEGGHKAYLGAGHETGLCVWGAGGGGERSPTGAVIKAERAGAGRASLGAWAPLSSHRSHGHHRRTPATRRTGAHRSPHSTPPTPPPPPPRLPRPPAAPSPPSPTPLPRPPPPGPARRTEAPSLRVFRIHPSGCSLR
jgi:hypothetical protein